MSGARPVDAAGSAGWGEAPDGTGVVDEARQIACALRAFLETEAGLGLGELLVPGGLPVAPSARGGFGGQPNARLAPRPTPRLVPRPTPRPVPRPTPRPASRPTPIPTPRPAPRPTPRAAPRPASRPGVPPQGRLGPAGEARPLPPPLEPGAGLSEREAGLAALEVALAGCRCCRLCERRRRVVFGVGNPDARLMFIGEGPGAEEDAQGEPFVGPAGRLLDRIIQAMGLSRGEVYLANVVKCRPPGNRTPMFDEVEACSPFLRRQIALVCPEVLVTLGRTATAMMLGRDDSIGRFRGRWHEAEGIPVCATYHPAYLLRTPSAKRLVWDDMRSVMERLGLRPPR